VLDSDIETTPAEQIQDIQVIETVFKGEMVFKKN
jgi:predicted amidohydrolase YtcJ